MCPTGKPNLRVLFIEDNPDDVLLIVTLLGQNWHVIWHRVENEGSLLLSLNDAWDVVLCDVRLPHFSASKALRILKEHSLLHNAHPTVFIAMSGQVDEEEAIDLLRKGARDFIGKDKLSRLSLAIQRELRQSGELFAKELYVVEMQDAVIEAWGKALELRDAYTAGHTERVTACALRLAMAMNVGHAQFVDLNRGAFLHDIGKMGMPDSVLFKQDTLTDDEWKIMRTHPQLGHDMLYNIPFLREASLIPYCHHERWNGTGYPQGLIGSANEFSYINPSGRGIPFLARLFSVVDVYDALVTDRPYRPSWPKPQAVAYLLDEAGVTFDPDIVRVFVEMIGRG